MAKPGTVIGWKLDRDQRTELLNRFPPRYEDAIADHITLRTNAESESLPPAVDAKIIGRADDGDSLEAMVVSIDDAADRPDGSIFHITWSLDRAKGRRAKESNDLLKERSWEKLEQPIAVNVRPARFP